MDQILNVKPETIKIIEENIGSNILTLLIAIFFQMYLPSQAEQTKNK